MRHVEVAVVGLGLAGSAALDALMRRGVDAIGLDPLPPGSEIGSSHGSCRVFRRFNFENPNYTKLSDDALAGWDRLATASGQQILIPSPVLEAGPKGSAMVAASRKAALDHGLQVPLLSGRDVNARFPAFNLPEDWDVVLQHGGAILLADVALRTLRAAAEAAGRVVGVQLNGIDAQADKVVLTAVTGEQLSADSVILTLGPWLTGLAPRLPRLAELLEVTRQCVAWCQPAQPEMVKPEVFPLFILARSEDDVVYGFPDFEGRGVKAAPHNRGPVVGPNDWGTPATDTELQAVTTALAALVPGAAGPITERDVCLYTNTKKADRRPDNGDEFILDRWPTNKRIIIGSACSGHGAKFAPAIGERLASLATDRSFRIEPFFRLSRFSAFPGDADPVIEDAMDFYADCYDVVFHRLWDRTDRHELGDRSVRCCRFCGKRPPDVTFENEAHAVPEALGNRGLTSTYECDECNGIFGRGIENDLGEWSKPLRTFARIRGKRGMPRLKQRSDGEGWRIEHKGTGFAIQSYEDDPLYTLDEAKKRITFHLKRGAYTPVAVFKAFVKIGLTLMPEVELTPFQPALDWVRDSDHSRSFIREMSIIHTFQNGPMPPDKLVAFVLRRKPGVTGSPYAYLVLGYGNEVFQVVLPAPDEDQALNGTSFKIPAFPTPGGLDPKLYGRPRPKLLDMTGRTVVRGEMIDVPMSYDRRVEVGPDA